MKNYNTKKNKSNKFEVECMECGKKFKTASMTPKCPRCHGEDIEPV